MVRVFATGPGDRVQSQVVVIPKPHCLILSIIRYVSRVNGTIQRKK